MNTAVRLCLASALAVSSTAQDPPALTQTVRELRAIRGADSKSNQPSVETGTHWSLSSPTGASHTATSSTPL